MDLIREFDNVAHQDVLSQVVELKGEKEEALKNIRQLENAKLKLEMENQVLKGKLNVRYEDEQAIQKKMREMNQELEDKKLELEELKKLNSILLEKEHRNKDEIHEAHKEVIEGCLDLEIPLPSTPDTETSEDLETYSIRTLGELSPLPFWSVCKQRFPPGEAKVRANALRSRWQEILMDPGWHPFKIKLVGDKNEEVVDEGDAWLKKLKAEWGDNVHNAVKTALEELNECNPRGRFPVRVMWNRKERRKATLKEVVAYTMDKPT